MSRSLYLKIFRQLKHINFFLILYSVQFVCGDTEAYSQPKTYIIKPSSSNSNFNLSNETYIYQPGMSTHPDMQIEQEVQDFTYNPYSYYYTKNSKYHSTMRPYNNNYQYPEDKFKYSMSPKWRSKYKKSSKTKSRRRHSKSPYNYNTYGGVQNNKWFDPSYPNAVYKPNKGKESMYGSGYGYGNYGSYGQKSKNKYGSKQQFQNTPSFADYENDLNFDNIFDLSDDDMEDLDHKAEDLLFGDYQDPLQEETFLRPSVIGLNSGVNIAAAGLNGISHVLPGVGFGGLRGIILGTILGLPRFSAGKLLGGGLRIFIALMLLPLILLFLPLPMFAPPPNANISQRNSEDDGTLKPESNQNQIVEFGRKVLSSENCIERISCEINHFNEITGMEAENIWFTRFMRVVSSFEGFFPDFMIKMARGYMNSSDDNSCSRFECQSLRNHLNFI